MKRSLLVVLVLLCPSQATAKSTGIAGYSGKGSQSCEACHTQTTALPQTYIIGPTFLQPGQKATFIVRTGATWGGPDRAGFDLAASGGTLSVNSKETTTTKLLQGEVVHSQIKLTDLFYFTAEWSVDWTAPMVSSGVFTLYAAGLVGLGTPTDMLDAFSKDLLTVHVGTCSSNADCNDNNPCTTETCDILGTKKCTYVKKAGCCLTAKDCDDGNPCTSESCTASNTCTTKTISGCCTSDAACADSDPCTTDLCDLAKHTCSHAATPDCCSASSPPCNDGNACTTDTCNSFTGKCTYTPKAGCCTKDADCADSNPCTNDTCTVATGACANTLVTGCCQSDTQCADTDPCTTDKCTLQACVHTKVPTCCTKDGDCDDSNPCTADKCLFSACQHTVTECPVPDGGPFGDARPPDGSVTKPDGSVPKLDAPAADAPASMPAAKSGGCSLAPGSSATAVCLLPLGLAFLLVLCRRRRNRS
jgi:hypothetical protein